MYSQRATANIRRVHSRRAKPSALQANLCFVFRRHDASSIIQYALRCSGQPQIKQQKTKTPLQFEFVFSCARLQRAFQHATQPRAPPLAMITRPPREGKTRRTPIHSRAGVRQGASDRRRSRRHHRRSSSALSAGRPSDKIGSFPRLTLTTPPGAGCRPGTGRWRGIQMEPEPAGIHNGGMEYEEGGEEGGGDLRDRSKPSGRVCSAGSASRDTTGRASLKQTRPQGN